MNYTVLIQPTLTRAEFKTCFDQWFDELRNYITYRCGDVDLATDIVQEAFMKIWEKKMSYQGKKTRGLLYKIASELWISQYRKSTTEKNYKLTFDLKNQENNTENELLYQELKEKYEAALKKLPEKRRVVFLMNRVDELTYSEIAERLNISVKAVEKRMKLALQELKEILNYGKTTAQA